MPEQQYLEALDGIHSWICAKGHCHWDGDYMLVDEGEVMECPVKMMLDSVEFHKYLGWDTIPDKDGKCPYIINGLTYQDGQHGAKG